jgi:hypothetical protein
VAKLDRAQFDRVGINPRALDPELPRQLGRVDKLAVLKPPLFEQLDYPAGDCLDCLGIEFDARGWHPDSTVQGGGPLHRPPPKRGVPSVSCSWDGG